MRAVTRLVYILLPVIITGGCGSSKQRDQIVDAGSFLAEKFEGTSIHRTSGVEVYVDSTLWQYINGGADLYLDHNFVAVATADYADDSVEVTADIYRFATEADAIALYMAIAPPDLTPVTHGSEGYASTGSIRFVEGPYLVVLTGFDGSSTTDELLRLLADRLAAALGA